MKVMKVVIKSEYDVILARQKAKRISCLAGLSLTDQTRFITAFSEITRNAIMYGNGGKVEFTIEDQGSEKFLQALIIDNSSVDLGKLVETPYKSEKGMGIGISGAMNLVDYFKIHRISESSNSVILGKKLPKENLSDSDIATWINQLSSEDPKSFFEEIQQQNQLLMQTLEKLEQREAQLKAQLDETVRLNTELENANQELRDFAYVVSHDLKAPLRGISSLAGWIASDYSEKLDGEGSNMLDMLIGRIHRMNNLIDGILQYSRVGRVKEDKVLINLNTLVKDVIAMVNPPVSINICVHANLPHITFEETRLIQVFQNLISNSIKYMDKEQGLVTIGYVDEGSYWKFFVKDNGPGIDEKYFDKIFKIFQTLNARDKVESTGIGLSIVKKIIDLYGGDIWVESKLGEGTTFFFTLLKK